MASITPALSRIKRDLDELLSEDRIESLCASVGHRFRRRALDPATTLRLWARQALEGNTACAHLRHVAGLSASVSAYGQARRRLPAEVLELLLAHTAAAAGAPRAESLWHGHRTLLIDGSGCSMPDTPGLARRYGYPANQKAGCAFPVAHLLALFDAESGLLLELLDAPCATADLALIRAAHERLREGDVLIGDRGFAGYAHLAALAAAGVHALLRVHGSQRVDFTPGRSCAADLPKAERAGVPTSRWLERLGHQDQLVAYAKPKDKPPWLSASEWEALPQRLTVRECRATVGGPGSRTRSLTLVTTLIDPRAYRKSDLVGLYRRRWEAETHLRELKQTLGLNVLRTRSPDMVRKEMLVLALVYNLVRLVMLRAAAAQGIAARRVSFTDALRHLAATGQLTPLIALLINPDRPFRREPRVVKRRPNPCAYMTKPRDQLRRASRRHAA